MASGGELHDIHQALVAGQVLRTYPRRPQEVLVVAALVVRLAPEDGEVERLADLGLGYAVVPVEVVVELLEGTLPEASGVRLHPEYLPVRPRPGGQLGEPVEVPVVFARGVEGVEQLHDRLEAQGAVDAHVDAEANLHGRVSAPQHRRDERGRRGHDVRVEALAVHLLQHPVDEGRKVRRNRLVAVAIAVEQRVEENPVLTAPFEVREESCADLLGEIGCGTARQDPRPGEEDLPYAPQMRGARLPERCVEEVPDCKGTPHLSASCRVRRRVRPARRRVRRGRPFRRRWSSR